MRKGVAGRSERYRRWSRSAGHVALVGLAAGALVILIVAAGPQEASEPARRYGYLLRTDPDCAATLRLGVVRGTLLQAGSRRWAVIRPGDQVPGRLWPVRLLEMDRSAVNALDRICQGRLPVGDGVSGCRADVRVRGWVTGKGACSGLRPDEDYILVDDIVATSAG